MTISLNEKEQKILQKLREIKKRSGSHSPSPSMLATVRGLKIKHDFCYISNSYATDLFLKHFQKDFKKIGNLRNRVEWYPSQSGTLSEKLAPMLKIAGKYIFVGNGATEIIQAVLQNFVKQKILIPVPTFSSYIEFAPKGISVVYHELTKERDFKLDPKEFLSDIRKEKPDAVVIINPNNPDGSYLNEGEIAKIMTELKSVPTVILDESFIHFTTKNQSSIYNSTKLFKKFTNLIIIKSLSKDYGIAGIRVGYAIMKEDRVSTLYKRGYLWNISGFGEYFLTLFEKKEFQKNTKNPDVRPSRKEIISLQNFQKLKV